MATAVSLDHSSDSTDVPIIVRASIVLGLVQAVCVFAVSMINRALTGTADHALLGLYDAEPTRFEAEHPEWTRIGEIARYQASSTLLPRRVVIYRSRARHESSTGL